MSGTRDARYGRDGDSVAERDEEFICGWEEADASLTLGGETGKEWRGVGKLAAR